MQRYATLARAGQATRQMACGPRGSLRPARCDAEPAIAPYPLAPARQQFRQIRHVDPNRGILHFCGVNIEQKVNDWVDAVTLRNAGNTDPWTARFLIEGYWPTVGAGEDLDAIGGSIQADGDNQYVLTFPASKSREAVEMVAEQGGWLCERQTIAPADR